MKYIGYSENKSIRRADEEELIKLAGNGNTEAMYELYIRLRSEDTKKAGTWLRKACKLGDSHAQYAMGIRYIEGDEGRWSILDAINWMRISAGNCYTEAEDFLEKYGFIEDILGDAEAGNAKAQGELASALMDLALEKEHFKLYRYDKNCREAVRWAKKAIQNDETNAKACGVLGYFSYFGEVIKKDRDKAIEYYKKGALEKEKRCLHGLGIQYLWGERVRRDAHKGFTMIKEAAKQGYAPAMYDLARCYRYALGTKGNLAKAVKWYSKAEANGAEELVGRNYTRRLEIFEELCPVSYYEDYPERILNSDPSKSRWIFGDDIIYNLSSLTIEEEEEPERLQVKKVEYDRLVDFSYTSDIPEGFVNAIAPFGDNWWENGKLCSFSGLRVFCKNKKNEAIACFRKSFQNRWWELLKFITIFYGSRYFDLEEKEPVTAIETDYGFFVSVSVIRPADWASIGADIGTYAEPIEYALCDVIRKYEVQRVDGTINFESSDGKWYSNDSFSFFYNVNPNVDIEYDFVGQALAGRNLARDIPEFIEDRYITAAYENVREIIDFLIRYSKWISLEQMEKVFSAVSDSKWLEENFDDKDSDKVLEYVRYAKACYLRGEKPRHEEAPKKEVEDYFNDFEAAVDMMVLAEKLEQIENGSGTEKKTIKNPFDKVFKAAEQGDIEAKFVAGKHLIADDVKRERERAIQWIREAADAGYTEAVKCIEKHPEVFKKDEQ